MRFSPPWSWRGGRVEYSTNNGSTWTNAGPLIIDNPYNGTAVALGPGTLGAGFTGQSHGYYSSRLNLTSLAGQAVRFRFRLATDATFGDKGWFIDDIRVYTCSTPPAANAGPNQDVPKNTAFTLNGSGSTDPDPDGDPVTYAWIQLAGTPATIQNPNSKTTSVAGVDADTRLKFRLTVTESHGLTHTDEVDIKVGNPK